MNDIIYNLLLAVITAMGAAFVRYALPWLKKQATKAETDLREKNYTFAAEIIKNLVLAVEQTVSGSGQGEVKFDTNLVLAVEQTVSGSGQGEVKFDTVESIAKQAFKDAHITITDTQLETLIESAVHSMNTESTKTK